MAIKLGDSPAGGYKHIFHYNDLLDICQTCVYPSQCTVAHFEFRIHLLRDELFYAQNKNEKESAECCCNFVLSTLIGYDSDYGP